MNATVRNVLFLCTHNSARSILGEALATHLGDGRLKGHSAGSPGALVGALAAIAQDIRPSSIASAK